MLLCSELLKEALRQASGEQLICLKQLECAALGEETIFVDGTLNACIQRVKQANEKISSREHLKSTSELMTLAQFGGSGDAFSSKAEVENINNTSAEIIGYLVDSNEHRASTTGEVDKLEGLVTFANPVVVTVDTTSLSMKFNVGEGMHLVNGGGNKLFIGSGPFQAIMSAN